MDEAYKHPAEEKKVKFRVNILGSKKENIAWIFIITVLSFFLSIILSFSSTRILVAASDIAALLIVLIIIVIGIIFDMIGIAVTAADEAPFHAMASRKLYGARQAIRLIRHANKVSSFCNDVVGDIAGVISGTASAFIIVRMVGTGIIPEATIEGLVITGLVASLTVGGKAVGKTIAIHNSNFIVYKVSVILKFVKERFKFLRHNGHKKKN